MMSPDVQINHAELRRQHIEHKARRARLMGKRIDPVKGDVDHAAHVHAFIAAQIEVVKSLGPVQVRIGPRMDAHVETYRVYLAFLREGLDPRITIVSIIKTVGAYYQIPVVELISHRRAATLVRARQVAMYLAKNLTPRSLPEIGRRVGGRDHTTVLHAVRRITTLRKDDAELDRDICKLMEIIGAAPTGATGGADG